MERKTTLTHSFYHTGEFARKASVTLRTLRYYDRVGLLSPSQYTEAGYRLYTDTDLLTLQQILALKFLGFSLAEIQHLLQSGPRGLEESLAQQREMMLEKRRQLDAIVKAIEHSESLLRAGECDWDSLVRVIEVIQMEQKNEWATKYFNTEQLEKLKELQQSSYSEEASRKLAQREWTEEDQKQASAQWAHVAAETQRLVAVGADPAGEEAQALAKLKSGLLFAFTQGDQEIEAGLARFWQNHNVLPEGEKPLTSTIPSAVTPGSGDAGAQFLDRAMEIYRKRQQTPGGASN